VLLDQVSGGKVPCRSAALGRLGRALYQVNVISVVRIKLKTADIGAFERLRGSAKRGAFRRGRQFNQLHQRPLLSAAGDGAHHSPRVELDKRRIEEHVDDDRCNKQNSKPAVPA
jgi:hypothetical protein